jgi:hypothetical protein
MGPRPHGYDIQRRERGGRTALATINNQINTVR